MDSGKRSMTFESLRQTSVEGKMPKSPQMRWANELSWDLRRVLLVDARC